MKRTTKMGTNKGKPRVWLEGTALVDAGFSRGDHFSFEITPGRLVIRLDADSYEPCPYGGHTPWWEDPKLIDMLRQQTEAFNPSRRRAGESHEDR